MGPDMEPLLRAWSCFRRRKFRQCAELCSQLLEAAPGEQEPDTGYSVFEAAWSLKTRALTEMVYVDEIDMDQEGIAEMMLDENAIAQVARPGTSLKVPGTSQDAGPTPAVRPVTQSGRPITGFVRPSTQSGRPSTMEQAIKTPRTALTARPVTSASGRSVRIGTASMITNPDGPFINLSRLNLGNYAEKPKLAKALFEYIFHHENEIKIARALLQTASYLAPHMYEPHFNFAILSEKVGDLQRSYTAAQKSAEAFPGHVDTQQLIKRLKERFAML
uniref:Tetratricopeptide repeat domain 8 n=1 Tax=Cairina moschata TaxID=8855 RepID=A0A8C3GKE2_CAIMO